MKNIGILTFHASHNYGSMLQAYALQTFLESQGCKVEILNYRILAQKAMYNKLSRVINRTSIREMLRGPRLFCQNMGKWKKFEAFLREYLHVTKEVGDLVSLENLVKEQLSLDAIITGGDQIWNMNCVDFSIAYYLPFETKGIRRIAYSPSMGGLDYWEPSHYPILLKAMLEQYDYLSVREQTTADYLTDLMGKEVTAVIDPTLLLDKAWYIKLAGEEPIVNGRYIFYYSPVSNPEVSKYVLRFAKHLGLKVVVSNGKVEDCRGFIHKNNTGPKEFLNLLFHAEIVMGRSLHLAVFSMILHKQFFVVVKNKEKRMGDLLDSFGLSKRYIRTDMGFSQIAFDDIDWNDVDNRIQLKRVKAIEYLKMALL